MMAALVALLLAAPAEPLPLELSLRAGYARSFGNVESSDPLSLSANDLIPLSVDVRYRIYRSLSLATSFEFAPALLCSGRCSASAFRVALAGHWQPREGEWRPFASLGLGYEWLRRSQHALAVDVNGVVGDVEVSRTAQGLAFAVAQAGAERELSSSLRLGPYALASVGSYSKEDIHYQPPITPDQSRSPSSVHGFVQVGVRLSFEP